MPLRNPPQAGAAIAPSKKRSGGDDLSGNTLMPTRTRDSRGVTEKQQAINEDRQNSREKEIEKLRKELVKANKKINKTQESLEKSKAAQREYDVENESGPESEDPTDDEQGIAMSSFSLAVQSQGVVNSVVPRKILRKDGDRAEPTVLSPCIRNLSLTPALTGGNGFTSRGCAAPSLSGGASSRKHSRSRSSENRHPISRSQSRSRSPSRKRQAPMRRIARSGSRSSIAEHGTSSPPHLVSQMHARSGSRSSIIKHRTSSPPRSSSPVDIPPQKVSLFVGNQAPFKGQRANVKDYEEPVPTLLLKVIREYSASIWACHPFPSQQQQGGWANSMWYNVSRQDPEGAYVLTERMRKLITSRGSHARGYLKDKIRPLVGPAYGFKTLTDKPAIIAKNLKIYTSLISNSSFHYKDPRSLSGYCGHSIILDAVRGIWFKNQAAPGLEFSSYFSPIRIVSLALILTAIEFCIQEFSTGRFVQAVFDEKDNKLRFEAHLQDLTEWAELKPDITDKILQKMHDRCRKGTGAAMDLGGRLNDKTRQRALLELEARTGDTDTDSDEEGR